MTSSGMSHDTSGAAGDLIMRQSPTCVPSQLIYCLLPHKGSKSDHSIENDKLHASWLCHFVCLFVVVQVLPLTPGIWISTRRCFRGLEGTRLVWNVSTWLSPTGGGLCLLPLLLLLTVTGSFRLLCLPLLLLLTVSTAVTGSFEVGCRSTVCIRMKLSSASS